MLNNKGFDLWADGYDKSVGCRTRMALIRLRDISRY